MIYDLRKGMFHKNINNNEEIQLELSTWLERNDRYFIIRATDIFEL